MFLICSIRTFGAAFVKRRALRDFVSREDAKRIARREAALLFQRCGQSRRY